MTVPIGSTRLFNKTRLHSSRMRTARTLTVSPSMLCSGEGCLLWGVHLVPGMSAPGVYMVPGGGYLVPVVYLVPGGCTWSRAVYLVPGGEEWGVSVARGVPRYPLWTEFLTHASENTTLPETSFAGGNKENDHANVKTFHACIDTSLDKLTIDDVS